MPNPVRVPAASVAITLLLVGCAGGGSASARTPLAAPTATEPLVGATPTSTPAPASAAASATPMLTKGQLQVGGLTRTYIAVTPPDVADRDPLPLLLTLHGGNVTTPATMSISGFDELAIDPGAIIVYVEGYENSWNAGTCCKPANTRAVDDIAFIHALIDQLEADYPVDLARVYIGGDGTGGSMAFRAACELSDRFAAVAVVSGPLFLDCNPSTPISALLIQGTADVAFPYDGGGTACDGRCPSFAQTMERWRQADGCSGEPTTTTEGIVVTTTFSTCTDGVEVEFIAATGLDDTWLGPGIDDRAVIWAFLMEHARGSGPS